MQNFKIGDLVEFIPENFNYPSWNVRLIGVGYIERIQPKNVLTYDTQVYYIYCGKLTQQQMNNFVEIDLEDQTIRVTGLEIQSLCRKLNS